MTSEAAVVEGMARLSCKPRERSAAEECRPYHTMALKRLLSRVSWGNAAVAGPPLRAQAKVRWFPVNNQETVGMDLRSISASMVLLVAGKPFGCRAHPYPQHTAVHVLGERVFIPGHARVCGPATKLWFPCCPFTFRRLASSLLARNPLPLALQQSCWPREFLIRLIDAIQRAGP